MRWFSVAWVGLSFVVSSCSASGRQTPSRTTSDSATLVSPSSVMQATVDGSRIFGSQLELSRDESGVRGRGPLGIIDLRKESDSLRGTVGSAPTELHLESTGDDGFSLRGLYGGVLGNLEVRPDRIEGQLGRCQYNLRRYASEEGTEYNGRRVCTGRGLEAATFKLTSGITSLAPLDRAAVIAVVLGR